MAMTPELQTLKAQYISEVNGMTNQNNRRYCLPYGEDFELQHKFFLHRNKWRVSLCMLKNKYEWHTISHCADFSNREDALRETYRLNGWGEPKPRN